MATEKTIEQELKKDMKSQIAPDVTMEYQGKYFNNASEISKSAELIKYLYVNKSQNFKYSLVQNKVLELPLYRERNFRFFFGKFLNFIFIQAFL
jgi:Zn/Cd-binding protein ZinT